VKNTLGMAPVVSTFHMACGLGSRLCSACHKRVSTSSPEAKCIDYANLKLSKSNAGLQAPSADHIRPDRQPCSKVYSLGSNNYIQPTISLLQFHIIIYS